MGMETRPPQPEPREPRQARGRPRAPWWRASEAGGAAKARGERVEAMRTRTRLEDIEDSRPCFVEGFGETTTGEVRASKPSGTMNAQLIEAGIRRMVWLCTEDFRRPERER